MADIDLIATKERLVQRLAALEVESQQASSSRDAVELDQTKVGRLSRMDAMQRQAMAQAVDRRRAQETARIRGALKRIDENEYGYCVTCGDEIQSERLELDLSIATCIGCANRAAS